MSARIDDQTNQAMQLFSRRLASRYDVLNIILFGSRARRE